MASTTFTYAILTGPITTPGSIRNWVQHSLIPAEQILEEAQQWIYQRFRHPYMLTETVITILDNASEIAVPGRFLEPAEIKLYGDSEELDYVHENMLGRVRDSDGALAQGRPQRYAYYGDAIKFDVRLDEDGAALSGTMLYYQEPEYLSVNEPTNRLTDRFGGLLRKTCVALGYDHRKRPEAASQYLLAEKAINEANVAADFVRRGQLVR